MAARQLWKYLIIFLASGGILVSPIEAYSTYVPFNILNGKRLRFRHNNRLYNKNSDVIKSSYISSKNYINNQSIGNSQEESILQIKITADRQYDLSEELFVAEGNVVVSLNRAVLKAERIEFNRIKNSIQAIGDVVFQSGSQYFRADLLRYNLIAKDGEIQNIYGVIDISNMADDLNLISLDKEPINPERLLKELPINNIQLKDGFQLQGGSMASSVNSITKVNLTNGSIKRWRFHAPYIKIRSDRWEADRVTFTNDPFNPSQLRIEAINVLAIENEDNSIVISSKESKLILEERISIPLGERKFGENEVVRWEFGVDFKDRDGLFIGRRFNPIEVVDDLEISLQPQFQIQRAISGKTNSYIKNGSSPASDKVNSTVMTSDLFGLKTGLKGTKYGWDIDFTGDITTFNGRRFANGSRYWGNFSRDLNFYSINDLKLSFFGSYRYKAWNGSLGETDIHSAYGGFMQKQFNWRSGRIENESSFSMGMGNYQAEAFTEKRIISLWKSSIYGSLDSKIPIWKRAKLELPEEILYRYSPVLITSEISLNTNLTLSNFHYENGDQQALLKISAGPEMIIGDFNRPFLDYTRISLKPGIKLKDGASPFKFDNDIDLKTIGIEFDQQIYGPLILSTMLEFNIDKDSNNHGNLLNSKIALITQRRAYDLGIFYQPHDKAGGVMININGFNFNGTGNSFL